MSIFITRIELHDATFQHYEVLHKNMALAGFRRTIQSDLGVTYHLPTAEYSFVGDVTLETVQNKAKSAAFSVGRTYGVLCTEAQRIMWDGLPQVR